jgi:hypothetical protein
MPPCRSTCRARVPERPQPQAAAPPLPQPHDRAQRVPPVDDAGAVDGRQTSERPPTAPWKTPSNNLASSTSTTRPSLWPVDLIVAVTVRNRPVSSVTRGDNAAVLSRWSAMRACGSVESVAAVTCTALRRTPRASSCDGRTCRGSDAVRNAVDDRGRAIAAVGYPLVTHEEGIWWT